MELVPAARRHVMNQPAVRGYVQHRVYRYELLEHVDQKGTRAIVLATNGGWAEPNRVSSAEFPVLVVQCWADCTRDDNGDKVAEDAIDNAMAVYRAVDPTLHRVRNAFWGDPGGRSLLVIDAKRWVEPVYQTKRESHGGVAYGVELGESAVVTVEYALTIAH